MSSLRDMIATGGLDESAFYSALALALCLEDTALRAETRFVDDLGFDSLAVFELVLVLEEAGSGLSVDDVIGLRTARDAFGVFQRSTTTA